MKLYTKNVGSNYLAKIVSIKEVQPHPNADKLALTFIDGNKVIVGKNTKVGDLYLFFPLECAINKDLIRSINGFSDPTLNADGKSKGFFNDKARVRAVKLRGVPSEGYLMAIESFLAWIGASSETFKLESYLNKEFDSVDTNTMKEVLVCEKYRPPRQYSKGPANTPKKDKTKRFDRMVEGQFHFHVDTAQLKKNIHKINPDDEISILYKLHGTNFVCGNLLVKSKLTWKDKIAKLFGCKVQETEYDILYSSRQVLKNSYLYDEDKKLNHYYKEDIWGHAKDKIASHIVKGYTIYAEIVGYTPQGSWVQKGYDYGCNPNEFEVYVFRMTFTNPDGKVFELSTTQVKEYCDYHGLKMAPILFQGKAGTYFKSSSNDWHSEFLNKLIEDYLEQDCKMSKNKIAGEGIVLRKEGNTWDAFKLKSFRFLMGETEALDKGDIGIDAES